MLTSRWIPAFAGMTSRRETFIRPVVQRVEA
jgi:hypothetical protein